MKFRPHHIALTVQNMEESIRWYQEKLGFEVIHRNNNPGMEITLLERGDARLEFFCCGSDTKPLPDYRKDLMDDLRIVGTKHLCIEVDNLKETINELKGKGVKFVTELDTAGFGGEYIFFRDCNGILIELYQSKTET